MLCPSSKPFDVVWLDMLMEDSSKVDASTGHDNQYLFFKFLSLANPKSCALNLAELYHIPPEEHRHNLFHCTLRKAQASGLEAFYDRLKHPASIQWARKMLDPSLRHPEYANQLKWCHGMHWRVSRVCCACVFEGASARCYATC